MTDLLTPDQAAAILGVPRSRVLALVRSGAVGVVRLGPRTVRIPQDAIEALVAQAYHPPHGEEGQGHGQRPGQRLPSPRKATPVGRHRHDRLDARGPSGPPQPLRRDEG